MKACSLLPLFLAPCTALAQTRTQPDFQVTRITRNLVSAPQFVYSGAQQYPTNQRDRWLEIEVEFNAVPEVTDDLTVKYFVLINGVLLTGEVTHNNVAAGRENRSVMYVSPRTLARFTGSRTATTTSVQNICIQIIQNGSIKDEQSLIRAQPPWHASPSRVAGLLLNKNETPFAPLYWDRYVPIKSPP